MLFYIRIGCGTCRGIEYVDVVTNGRWRRSRWRIGRSGIGFRWHERRSRHDRNGWNYRDYRLDGYGN